MTRKPRMYPYDAVYDHLDRSVLVEMFEAVFGPDLVDVEDLTRTELIDALCDFAVDREDDAEEMGENYPLRRPYRVSGMSSLRKARRTDGRRVYWCWMSESERAATALVRDISEVSWGVPPEVQAGDVIVTAVDCDPSLVICVEVVVDKDEENFYMEHRWIINQPVPVSRLESDIDASLPTDTTVLPDETGDAILTQLNQMLDHPMPVFCVGGDCVPDGRRKTGSGVHVLRILQDGLPECAACGDAGDVLELHYFRPRHFDLQLEIQDHLDDTAQLCSRCHRLCHSPGLELLRRFTHQSALECPECGEPRPRRYVWGMPSDPDGADADDVVIGGCLPPIGERPQYQCRACDTDFNVVRTQDVSWPTA